MLERKSLKRGYRKENDTERKLERKGWRKPAPCNKELELKDGAGEKMLERPCWSKKLEKELYTKRVLVAEGACFRERNAAERV